MEVMVGTTTNREREKEEEGCDVRGLVASSLMDCIEDELERGCLEEVWATCWRETLGVGL